MIFASVIAAMHAWSNSLAPHYSMFHNYLFTLTIFEEIGCYIGNLVERRLRSSSELRWSGKAVGFAFLCDLGYVFVGCIGIFG